MFGLFSHQSGPSDKARQIIFEEGRKAGYEEGVTDGMAKNFERSDALPEAEYMEAMQFLVSRGLELCCYDINSGGFRIQKRKYGRSN